MQTFFQNGDEQINGDGTPDLGAHGVVPIPARFSRIRKCLGN